MESFVFPFRYTWSYRNYLASHSIPHSISVAASKENSPLGSLLLLDMILPFFALVDLYKHVVVHDILQVFCRISVKQATMLIWEEAGGEYISFPFEDSRGLRSTVWTKAKMSTQSICMHNYPHRIGKHNAHSTQPKVLIWKRKFPRFWGIIQQIFDRYFDLDFIKVPLCIQFFDGFVLVSPKS